MRTRQVLTHERVSSSFLARNSECTTYILYIIVAAIFIIHKLQYECDVRLYSIFHRVELCAPCQLYVIACVYMIPLHGTISVFVEISTFETQQQINTHKFMRQTLHIIFWYYISNKKSGTTHTHRIETNPFFVHYINRRVNPVLHIKRQECLIFKSWSAQ